MDGGLGKPIPEKKKKKKGHRSVCQVRKRRLVSSGDSSKIKDALEKLGGEVANIDAKVSTGFEDVNIKFNLLEKENTNRLMSIESAFANQESKIQGSLNNIHTALVVQETKNESLQGSLNAYSFLHLMTSVAGISSEPILYRKVKEPLDKIGSSVYNIRADFRSDLQTMVSNDMC